MRELMKLELRKVLPFYLPAAVVLIGYIVFRSGVLVSREPWMGFGGAIIGALAVYHLFTDKPGTRSFLFSRPYTRRRLFMVRWGIGMTLIGLTFIAAAACLVSGLRQAAQVYMYRSPWYPMVRWHELNCLLILGGSLLLSYSATMLLMARTDLEAAEKASAGWFPRTQDVASGLALCWIPILMIAIYWPHMNFPNSIGMALGIAYLILVFAISALASLHAYRRMPVES